MSNVLLEYQLRIRNAGDTANALTVTSVRGGTNPWLSTEPQGDGQSFDPLTGASFCGQFTGRIADGITSGTDRIVTAQLEDTGFRQQLMDRRTFLEYRQDGGAWNVLIAGFLTALRLISGIEYEYTISDPTRAENDYTAFKPQTGIFTVAAPGAASSATSIPCDALPLAMASGTVLYFSGTNAILTAAAAAGATSVTVSALAGAVSTGERANYTESVASFVSRWPLRGCILGGPVRGGFLDQPDRGGWELTVDSRSGTETYLKFVAGYAPPKFERSTNAEECGTAANIASDPLGSVRTRSLADEVTTFQHAADSYWAGVIVELVGIAYYQPTTGTGYTGVAGNVGDDLWKHLVKDIRLRGMYIRTGALGSGVVPSAGTKVRVRAFTAEVSEVSPIFWTGHPVDLFATLWTEAGLSYSSSAITSTKNAIGADRRVSLIVKEPQPLGPFMTSLRAAFGIGVRQNSSGQLEAFPARIQYNAVPATTIGMADVATDPDGSLPEIFAIDRAGAIKKVVFEHTRLQRTQDSFDGTSTFGFVEQAERFERTNGDGGAVGNAEQSFTVSGMVHSADSYRPDIGAFVNALSLEIFDRYGRGPVSATVPGLRGASTDALSLGDECLNDLDVLPNHNKRLGDDVSVSARAMQILKSTWTPRGPVLQLLDSGPNAQPYATVPTHTIAASATYPRTVAELTITNASTLNAALAGIRIQMAVTTGSAPATTDYVDVAAYGPGQIPSVAIPLPSVVAGRKVYARAAATKVDKRPSSWSTGVSVTLTAITAPSAFAAASGADGSQESLTWTVGDSTMLTDVYLRASGAPTSDCILQITLTEGSNRYVQERLTPSTAYTSSVQHRDHATGDISALVDVTYTTAAGVTTLSPPVYPAGFTGTLDPVTGAPQRDGIYGIAVVAATYPGFTEIQVAVETSVGAGTYGAFATSGTPVPNVLGDWTIWQDVAANDGLRRQVKARHTREGASASSYCTTVTVTPWTPTSIPVYPTEIIVAAVVNAPATDTDAQTKVSVTVTATDPQGGTTLVALTALTSNATVLGGFGVGTYTTSPGTWTLSRPAVLKGSAHAQFTGDTNPRTSNRVGTTDVDIPDQGQQGAPVIDITVKQNGNPVIVLSGNSDTLSYTWAESTSAMPSDATAIAGTVANGNVVTITSSVTLTMGQHYYFKAVPWPQTSAGGTHGPIASAEFDRQNKSTTKTILINWAWFVSDDATGNWLYDGSQVTSNGSTSNTLRAPIDMPPGATITSISAELYSQGAADVAQVKLYRFAGGGVAPTQIGSTLSATLGAATYNTPSSSFTEVAGTNPYHLDLFLEAITSGGQGSRCTRATINYTSPDLTVAR